jgi:hypothetical protein
VFSYLIILLFIIVISDGVASNQLDPLVTDISAPKQQQLRDMDVHDDLENKFCDVDGLFSFLCFDKTCCSRRRPIEYALR